MTSDEEVERELREAAAGLSMMSEADYPVEVVRLDGSVELSGEYLRGLSGRGAAASVVELSPGELFRAAASAPEWKQGGELETARRFQHLLRLLEGRLEGACAYRVGEIDVAAYVLGRGPGGDWLGVSTRLIET